MKSTILKLQLSHFVHRYVTIGATAEDVGSSIPRRGKNPIIIVQLGLIADLVLEYSERLLVIPEVPKLHLAVVRATDEHVLDLRVELDSRDAAIVSLECRPHLVLSASARIK